MSAAQRIMTCRLLEKMKKQAEYSKKLGVEDVSVFRGERKNVPYYFNDRISKSQLEIL